MLGGVVGLINRYALTPATAWFQNRLLPTLENVYERVLRFALSGAKPWLFFYGMIGLLFGSLVLLGIFPPKVEFFPRTSRSTSTSTSTCPSARTSKRRTASPKRSKPWS